MVFCGVNWSAEQYGLPASHVTGMLEVVPVEETLRDVMRSVPNVHRLSVLSEDSTSEQSNTRLLDSRYRALGLDPSYRLVSDYAAWKSEFARAQRDADVVYVPTNGAIRGWDAADVVSYVARTIRKPVVSLRRFHDAVRRLRVDQGRPGAGRVGGRRGAGDSGGQASGRHSGYVQPADALLLESEAGRPDRLPPPAWTTPAKFTRRD